VPRPRQADVEQQIERLVTKHKQDGNALFAEGKVGRSAVGEKPGCSAAISAAPEKS
jgi:hypothetical protein